MRTEWTWLVFDPTDIKKLEIFLQHWTPSGMITPMQIDTNGEVRRVGIFASRQVVDHVECDHYDKTGNRTCEKNAVTGHYRIWNYCEDHLDDMTAKIEDSK